MKFNNRGIYIPFTYVDVIGGTILETTLSLIFVYVEYISIDCFLAVSQNFFSNLIMPYVISGAPAKKETIRKMPISNNGLALLKNDDSNW